MPRVVPLLRQINPTTLDELQYGYIPDFVGSYYSVLHTLILLQSRRSLWLYQENGTAAAAVSRFSLQTHLRRHVARRDTLCTEGTRRDRGLWLRYPPYHAR